MKKFLTIVMLMVLGLSLTSCGEKALSELSGAEIIEKAKADGANWTEDQWKDAIKGMLKEMKPMFEAMSKIKEDMENEKDPAKALAALGKIQEEAKKYEDLDKNFREFNKLAKSSENGKKALADEEWGKQVLKELGMPEDAFK